MLKCHQFLFQHFYWSILNLQIYKLFNLLVCSIHAAMEWVLCHCCIRVAVVLGLRQPRLLNLWLHRLMVTVCSPRQKGAWQTISFILIRQNKAEDSSTKWLLLDHIYYLCSHAYRVLQQSFCHLVSCTQSILHSKYLALELSYLCLSNTLE